MGAVYGSLMHGERRLSTRNKIYTNMTLTYFVHLYVQWEGPVGGFVYLSLLQDGTMALYYASKNDHPKVVNVLLECGAQVNKV